MTFAVAEEDAGKGSIVGEATLAGLPGADLTAPEVNDTTGDDYAFDGWSPALTTDENGNVIVPSEPTNYVAQWAADKNQDNVPDEDQPDAFTSICFAWGIT